MPERTYAFIDSQNLNLGIKSCGWELDFRKFRIYLSEKYKVDEAFLFIGYVPGNEKLFTFLQAAGYTCVFKPTLPLKNGEIKGNVDAELVLHTMLEYNNFDTAILVSGDGDFYCLVEYLIEQEKLKALMVPNPRYSSFYKRSKVQKFIKLASDLRTKINR